MALLNGYVGCSSKPFLGFKLSTIFGNFRKYFYSGYYDCKCSSCPLEYDGSVTSNSYSRRYRDYDAITDLDNDVEHENDVLIIYEIRLMYLPD
uniref:Uncharacterized protein n=1 Tax=Onchocerca volvulus TaxID=6282 RepID=A0A2K6VJF4_ONCVO